MTRKEQESNKKDVETKRRYLVVFFGKLASEWLDADYRDDRRIFVNIYNMLHDATAEMAKIKSTVIWVGYNNEFKSKCEEMRQIAIKFTGKDPFEGISR